jgi:RNA polymerase sigma-70 factor (ECF subfamily)
MFGTRPCLNWRNEDFSLSAEDKSPGTVPARGDVFATTRWTVVLAAGDRSSPSADAALEELCRTYWYPLYAYVRRQGHAPADAQDLTQEFFARLLQKNYLAGVSSNRGRFRAFLLAALKHFLANEWDRAHRQKRGGGATLLSLDWQDADTRYQIDPPDHLSPDKLYDRAWATTLLEQVVARLREESVAEGRGGQFEMLKFYLMTGKNDVPHAEAAAALVMSEGAVRVAVHRLRRRYRELLKQEIVQTLSDPAQAGEEMRALLGAFSDG